MNHLTQNDLIEYHYGESDQCPAQELHLVECPACAADYAALAQELTGFAAELQPLAPPARGAEYGEQVWQALRPSLPPAHGLRLVAGSRPRFRMVLSFAAAAAALVALAFYSGHLWEQSRSRPAIAAIPKPGPEPVSNPEAPGKPQPPARQQVIVFVLSDHLDRSERLLVELNHPDEAADDPALRTTARELLTENRLYRQKSATTSPTQDKGSGDPSIGIALDDLERVLSQVANDPNGPSREDITQLEKKLNTDSLLFEIRVLRSRTPRAHETSSLPGAAPGKGRTV